MIDEIPIIGVTPNGQLREIGEKKLDVWISEVCAIAFFRETHGGQNE